MTNIGRKKGLLIGVIALLCVSLLMVGMFFPIFKDDDGGGSHSTGQTPDGTKLTTYEDSVIEPGSNKVNGLTNEDWFSELVDGDQLDFATDAVGLSEFNSTDSSDNDLAGGDGTEEKSFDGQPASDSEWERDDDSDNGGPPRDIEEADIIKLEDDTLYVLNTYRGLMIIDVSNPDEPELISRVPLFGYPVEMYIVEPKAYVILTHYYNAFLWAEDDIAKPEYRHGSEIVIIDLTNLENPKVEKYIELDGFITDSRRVGEVIYLVANNYDYGYSVGGMGIGMDMAIEGDWGRGSSDVAVEDEKAEEPVSSSGSEGGSESSSSSSDSEDPDDEPREDKKEGYDDDEDDEEYSEPQEGTVVISVNMENLNDIKEIDREWFPGSSNEIHVTENAIFVAQPEYDYSYDEFDDYEYKYYTKVTYVDISDYHGKIKIRDDFRVEGNLADRYQMDYYENTFRIVTHFWGEWRELGSSTLWVYDTTNPDSITKKGELDIDDAGSLMATRFAGERAYTIHLPYSIDPLDVIDLSDPSNPELTDILEIPGWVTHMEVRGLKILALGVDDSDGNNKVAVSLFDVTNPENAVMKDRVIIGDGYSWSTANWDPKALTVIDDQNLILVPFESRSYDEKEGEYKSFSGLQIVKFDLQNNDLEAGGAIEQMGTVERTRANSERIFALSYRTLQVIDAKNFNKPSITATLELCNNIIDIIPMGDYSVQVISDYDYNNGKSVTQLRTVSSTTPDTSNFLAEKTVEYGIIKLFTNDKFIYLVCSDYSYETGETKGMVLVFDYSNPKNPVLTSEFEMEYFKQDYYWRYYDYYGGGYYYSGSQVTDYNFVQVDDDMIVYHPSPEYDYYYDYDYEDDIVYDEENKTETPPEKTEEKTRYKQNQVTTYNEYLYIIDLSNPKAPKDASNISLVNTSRVTGLYSNGNTLFIIQYDDYSSYDDNYNWNYVVKYYLTKIDLSNPEKPKMGNQINIPGGFMGTNEAGTIVYSVTSEYDNDYNWRQILSVLELTDTKAVLKSAIDLGDTYPSILIEDTTIIISYSDYYYYGYGYYEEVYYDTEVALIKGDEPAEPVIKTRIQIIDASTPSSLKLKATIGLKNWGNIYKLENDKLYIQLSDANGLLIYDISNTRAPLFEGYFPTQGWVSSIREDVSTGRIYLAAGYYGVLMIEFK